MIYLVVMIVPILPLLMLGCIKRTEKAEPTLLPFSTMERTPLAPTSKEAESAAPKQPSPSPQPPSEGAQAKDTKDTSTTKKNSTDKQTSGRTDKDQPSPVPSRPHPNNSFPRQQSRTPEPEPEEYSAREREGIRRRTRLSPSSKNSPNARTRGPPGSKKSKKSRKANQPRSPSLKEFQAKTKKAATPLTLQSKTDASTLPSKVEAHNNSAMTALSEYVFSNKKHQLLGKVDQIIGDCDEADVLHSALNTQQSVTALTPTNPARSPFFDGTFSVWIGDRVGSQAE